MKTLLKLAEPTYENDSKNFTKVLAMYILASLFKDTRIGEEVLKFVENVIMVAINGFDSKYWNVRNASTILYSSLLNRIFGVSRSRDEISKKNRHS
jgi:thyroid adenoma-associated protein